MDLYAGEGNRILKPVVGSSSVLLLDGAAHQRDRKLMSPMFHGDRMRAYSDAMRDIVNKSIDQWPVGVRFPVHEKMQAITLDIILATVFGVGEDEMQKYRDILLPFMEWGATPLFLLLVDGEGELKDLPIDKQLGEWGLKARVLRTRQKVWEMLDQEIESRRGHTAGREDVLSLLVDATFEDGTGLSTLEIRDELLTLLIAGHETTATSLSWLVTWLHKLPQVTQQVREEIADVGGGGPVPNDRINDLKYTFATIKENLRRRPVLPLVMRRAQRDLQLGTLNLPAGGQVAPAIYGTHHHPDLWEEPDAFRPERFNTAQKPWHFFPFGGGNRTCLGMAFAYQEMRILASELVRRVDFSMIPGYEPRVVRRNITLAPSKGVPIVVHKIRD